MSIYYGDAMVSAAAKFVPNFQAYILVIFSTSMTLP
jgi:hypothetical protein